MPLLLQMLLNSAEKLFSQNRNAGRIRILERTFEGELAESTSYDDGETWIDLVYSGIVSPNTRFFITHTPTGNVLLTTPTAHRNKSYIADTGTFFS